MTQYNTPALVVPSATPSTTDAAQYMVINGQAQYNLCGEFSVCFCAQGKTGIHNIDEFLLYLKSKDAAFVNSLFPNGIARTTGTYDLDQMLKLCGYTIPSKTFVQPNQKIDPPSIQSMLKTHRLIVGVHIDNYGYFVGSGVAHWVVLEDIKIADSQHAVCDFYNPYTNLFEPYSWREFMTTTGSYKNGLYVER